MVWLYKILFLMGEVGKRMGACDVDQADRPVAKGSKIHFLH